METQTKQFIINCIEQHRSDDYTRAKMAFRNCTPKEMLQKYGDSDQTRQQILDGYRKREQQCNEAIAELEA